MSTYKADFCQCSTPHDGVLVISLHRPPVNAAHEPLWREVQRLVECASDDGDVRAVVLASTNPRFFTAGLDLNEAADTLLTQTANDPSRRALQLRRHILDFQEAITSLERCLKPVIVAIHGLAYGLALDIAFACDIRLAAADVRFAIKEVDIGLAADIGSLQRGPKVTGNTSLFAELALTGRDFGAEDALRLGAVSRIVPGGKDEVLREALSVARIIASKSPVAVVGCASLDAHCGLLPHASFFQSTKHILNASRDVSVPEGLALVANWNAAMLQSEDIGVAVAAAMSKKKPVFAKL